MSEVALRLGKFLAVQIRGGWELSVQEKDRGIGLGKCRVKFEWEQKVVSSNVACPPHTHTHTWDMLGPLVRAAPSLYWGPCVKGKQVAHTQGPL